MTSRHLWLSDEINYTRQALHYDMNECGGYMVNAKAWFPLNASVIATNRSCLLARTLLRFRRFPFSTIVWFIARSFVFGGM